MHPVLAPLRSIFDKLSEAIIITRPDPSREIIYVNEAAATLLRCDAASLISTGQEDIVGRQLPPEFDGTLRVNRPTGETFLARWVQAPYPSGYPDFLVSIVTDITTAQRVATAVAEFDAVISRGKQQIAEQRAIRHSLRRTANV